MTLAIDFSALTAHVATDTPKRQRVTPRKENPVQRLFDEAKNENYGAWMETVLPGVAATTVKEDGTETTEYGPAVKQFISHMRAAVRACGTVGVSFRFKEMTDDRIQVFYKVGDKKAR